MTCGEVGALVTEVGRRRESDLRLTIANLLPTDFIIRDIARSVFTARMQSTAEQLLSRIPLIRKGRGSVVVSEKYSSGPERPALARFQRNETSRRIMPP